VTAGRCTVYWSPAGPYDIDLVTGELMSQVVPVSGIYSVDRLTGRVEGTRCRVSPGDMLRLDDLRPGDVLKLEHDAAVLVQVDVVDALPSEGALKIFVRTRREAAIGHRYRTGWRVSAPALEQLRTRAGLAARSAMAATY
jgi:hypothetical protein